VQRMQGAQQTHGSETSNGSLHRTRQQMGQPIQNRRRWRPCNSDRTSRSVATRSAQLAACASRTTGTRSDLLLRSSSVSRRSVAAARKRHARGTHRMVARTARLKQSSKLRPPRGGRQAPASFFKPRCEAPTLPTRSTPSLSSPVSAPSSLFSPIPTTASKLPLSFPMLLPSAHPFPGSPHFSLVLPHHYLHLPALPAPPPSNTLTTPAPQEKQARV